MILRITYSLRCEETRAVQRIKVSRWKLLNKFADKTREFQDPHDSDKNEFFATAVMDHISHTSNPSSKHFWNRNIHKPSRVRTVTTGEKQQFPAGLKTPYIRLAAFITPRAILESPLWLTDEATPAKTPAAINK